MTSEAPAPPPGSQIPAYRLLRVNFDRRKSHVISDAVAYADNPHTI
jgi:hypothetical protein